MSKFSDYLNEKFLELAGGEANRLFTAAAATFSQAQNKFKKNDIMGSLKLLDSLEKKDLKELKNLLGRMK